MNNSFENIKYFKLKEFDSPDMYGSGKNMQRRFLLKLDKARETANIPFIITSGFRTENYNQELIDKGYQAVNESAHCIGLAADIYYSQKNFNIMLNSLIGAGFKRIGIGKSFFHVDIDDNNRPSPAVWVYDTTPSSIAKLKGKIYNYIKDIIASKKKLKHFVCWLQEPY
ncbi:MAG: hypothetical protein KAT68_00705 [Bacteroidales bacterium]|nr:hypothetical protein [Bacteroidales bacterium]